MKPKLTKAIAQRFPHLIITPNKDGITPLKHLLAESTRTVVHLNVACIRDLADPVIQKRRIEESITQQ
jgi:hypothetical protein